jgi:hypothetical protein
MNKFGRACALVPLCALTVSCFQGTGDKDELRDPVALTGISLGLQVNLHNGATSADAAATIYKDAQRQPLVGGDFFLATSSVEEVMLKSLENLSGDYLGRIALVNALQPVTLSTAYDPVRAREDRWYPVDQLLVDPGPNQDLVGYSSTITLPEMLENLAINSSVYTSRSDEVVLTWDAGNGQQMTSNAVVTCRSADGRSYTYPRFNVLGSTSDGVDAAGTFTLEVRDIIPNVNIINAVATLQHELATLITAAVLALQADGLINASNIPLSVFVVQSCTVDLTVFREIGFDLPENIVGGYAIGSTSDTVRFTFQPAVVP